VIGTIATVIEGIFIVAQIAARHFAGPCRRGTQSGIWSVTEKRHNLQKKDTPVLQQITTADVHFFIEKEVCES
jgi:hypothetical protein